MPRIKLVQKHLGIDAGAVYNASEAEAAALIGEGIAAHAPTSPEGPAALEQRIKARAEEMFVDAHAQVAVAGMLPVKAQPSFGWYLANMLARKAEALVQHGAVRHTGYPGSPTTARGTQKAAFGETAGNIGGYLVPTRTTQLAQDMIRVSSLFRRFGALAVPFSGLDVNVPGFDVSTARPAGTPPWFGGSVVRPTNENTGAQAAEPVFKDVSLVKVGLMAALTISNALLADGIAAEASLQRMFGKLIAWLENYYFLAGSGINQPLGVLNAPASIKVNRQSAASVKAQDLGNMLAALVPGDLDNAFFAVSMTTLAQITGINGWIPNGPLSYADIPIVPTDVLPPLGNAGDVCLCRGDWYAIADHLEPGGVIEVAASEHVNFIANQTVVRVFRRFDGQPLVDAPITVGDGRSKVSPFVVLN
jgi:HK97 family phage major capsid protein